MRTILAPILAFAAQAGALVVPRDGATSAVSALTSPADLSREIIFTASNGSDVTINIGTGFGIVDDLHKAPPHIAKKIKFDDAKGYAQLCKVVATQQGGSGMPRRDDCQALHDYVKNHNVIVYFEDPDSDLARWAEIFWVGTCAFRAKTSYRDLVFSNADVANVLDRTLSRRAWTIDGRVSASGEVDCAVVEGGLGEAPMFWRLQERHAPQSQVDNVLEARGVDNDGPLVVETLEMIPKNTSAYVLHSHVHKTAVDNTTELGAIINDTISKHFLIHTGGDIKGPNCKPTWLSSSWDDSNIPRRADCEQLLSFVANNKASIEFKERDLDFWAKFAAHGTCGVMFQTTKPKMIVNNRDMQRFLDNAVRWENCNTADGGTKAKMGVKCYLDNDNSGEQFDGEFRLFWRDPNLPVGQLERREGSELSVFGNIELLDDEDDYVKAYTKSFEDSTEPIHPPDNSPGVEWMDFGVNTKNGQNDTFQMNAKVLPASHQLGARFESIETPFGPSKRCNKRTRWMGGAHKDSALVEDCKKLRDYIGQQRVYWKFSDEEINNARRDGLITPIAKYGTCHFGYAPEWPVVMGNMDAEFLLSGAIEHLDNTHGRMRGWSFLGCDFQDQWGSKADSYWKIWP